MLNIALIKGDGTGPEVVNEATKVLETISTLYKIDFNFTELPYNATRFLKTGEILSDAELDGLKHYDAILLGAIGHPDAPPGVLEQGILLKIRFGLEQYINLRPVKLYENVDIPLKNKGPKDIDYVVIRENTGGLYSGGGEILNAGTENATAIQKMVYSKAQINRCLNYAFDYAKNRRDGKAWANLSPEDIEKGYTGKLTLVGKSNVLSQVFELWNRELAEIAKNYPSIKTDYIHVDAACIYMIECPERFDCIVTTNMFGDIITDLAATTQGGMGVAPGANINPDGVSMFEPIGGTAPDFTGKNEINPIAAIGSAGLMLDHLGYKDAAKHLDTAIAQTIKKMDSMAAGKMGYGTDKIGDMIVETLKNAQ